MMMRSTLLILFLASLFIASCGNDGLSEGENGQQEYTYDELGWTMQVPKGWEVLSKARRTQLGNAAQSFYGEGGSEMKEGEKEIIFGAKKGEKDVNAVYAFIRKYSAEEAEAPDMSELLRQQEEGYNTIPYSAETSLEQLVIGDHSFDKAIMQVYYDDRPYFKYTTYSTMIDTVNFGVTIISNNEQDEQMLTENFTASVKDI